MKIQELYLHNFLCIPRLTLKNLNNLNCFIGPHNSGKTNILDGISIFWDPSIRARVQQKQLKQTLGQQTQYAPPILSYIEKSNIIRGIFELGIDQDVSSWRKNGFLREAFVNTAILHKHEQPLDFFTNFLDVLETVVNLSEIKSFNFNMTLSQETWSFAEQKCYLRLKNNELIDFQSNNLSIIQQAIGLAYIHRFHEATDYDILTKNISRLIKNKNYKAISAVESFLQDVIGQEFVFELGKYHNDKQEIEVTIEQAFSCDLWKISSATARIIALGYLLTASPLNQIIIIDDPSLHLHPKGERNLAKKLVTFSENHQLLFSTHSTRLLIGHAYLVELTKGWTKVQPIQGDRSMKKVVKLLGIRPSDSFGADVVVFVEGRTDARILRVFEDIIASNRNEIHFKRVSYIGVGGWTNMKFVLSIEILRSKFVRSRAVAITDGDIVGTENYFKIKKNWSLIFPEDTFFSLKEESIESLFLNNPIVFLRVHSNKKNDLPSINELQQFIAKNRNKGISDKNITREILKKYFEGRPYRSSVAEALAKKFLLNEIPDYLVEFFNALILR